MTIDEIYIILKFFFSDVHKDLIYDFRGHIK